VPRGPRVQPAGGIFHVTARGNRRQEIFVDDQDRVQFLALLAVVVARLGWRCHAYCLMTNHFHLLVETPVESLSLGMQRLNGAYAQAFNRRHGYDGHLFQGRFHSVAVESDWHLFELSRYIVLNPVRAGLCAHPGAWRWSSYRALVARPANAPAGQELDGLLAQFADDARLARQRYEAFVADARLPRQRDGPSR
jgi:REP element-mobilizing transposase RayT